MSIFNKKQLKKHDLKQIIGGTEDTAPKKVMLNKDGKPVDEKGNLLPVDDKGNPIPAKKA